MEGREVVHSYVRALCLRCCRESIWRWPGGDERKKRWQQRTKERVCVSIDCAAVIPKVPEDSDLTSLQLHRPAKHMVLLFWYFLSRYHQAFNSNTFKLCTALFLLLLTPFQRLLCAAMSSLCFFDVEESAETKSAPWLARSGPAVKDKVM